MGETWQLVFPSPLQLLNCREIRKGESCPTVPVDPLLLIHSFLYSLSKQESITSCVPDDAALGSRNGEMKLGCSFQGLSVCLGAGARHTHRSRHRTM